MTLLSVEAATASIRSHLARKYPEVMPTLLGDAAFDEKLDAWVGLVAVTPWGPLVRVAFTLSLAPLPCPQNSTPLPPTVSSTIP